MKHLKLVINNKNKKRDIFFNKAELQLILNLYVEMVSGGEWKDYGLSISKREVSFNVYHKASEFPVYKITKNLKPKNENEKYLIKDATNKIIKNSENLQNLIKKIIWKKLIFYIVIKILMLLYFLNLKKNNMHNLNMWEINLKKNQNLFF